MEHLEHQLGNTDSLVEGSKKSRSWTFTHWFPDEVSSEQLEQTFRLLEIKAYMFQLEVGDEDKPHYQGVLTVKNPIVMPKWLDPRIHWEKARSWQHSLAYCQKQKGRLSGPWFLGCTPKKELKVIQELYGWQAMVKEMLDEEPDGRTINWLWEPTGNSGKTVMAKFICSKYRAIYVNGKGADAKYAVSAFVQKNELQAVIFGYPRSAEEYINYGCIEEIKDGIFFNSKYESGMCMYNPPHVFVFANFPPDESKMSADRWNVIDIREWDK